MTTTKRSSLWVLAGVALTSIVLLADLSRLLGSIESVGQRAYDARVFTGFRVFFWNTSELGDAIRLWAETQASFDVERLLSWHLLVDAIAFTPAYSALIGLGLRALGGGRELAWTTGLALFVIDCAETATTSWVLVHHDLRITDGGWLAAIQVLSLLKWIALAATLVLALVLLRSPGGTTTTGAVRRARRGEGQTPGLALLGLVVVVLLFVALVALPGGGPLDQIPDVVRAQLATGRWGGSALALLLLGAAVAAAGTVSTDPRHARAPGSTLRSRNVILAAAALSAVLMLVACAADGEARLVPLAPLFVAAAVTAAAWLARRAGVSAAPPQSCKEEPGVRDAADRRAVSWIGALAGLVCVSGGLAVLRASFPPALLEVKPGPHFWAVRVIAGIVVALLGGLAVQGLVTRLHAWAVSRRGGGRIRRGWPWLVAGATVAVAAFLAIRPAQGRSFGSLGVAAVGFALLAVVVGALAWASRSRPAWSATRDLGFGARTPWFALVVATWVVASIINTEGIYHDVRVGRDLGPATPRYPDVEQALKAWVQAQSGECRPKDGDSVPLVLVAAPGGGIRAAYWTAATLDSLFGPEQGDCAVRRLFAVSGVSGGSVGAAAWISARAKGAHGGEAVKQMAQDRGLAAAVAGLLLRDLYQPFTGIATRWRDRAALLEDGWAETAGVFGGEAEGSRAPLRWAALGEGLDWIPVLVLNASSVTDGCRVLVSNTGALPAASGPDCAASTAGARRVGPVSGAIDPLPGLYRRGEGEADACREEGRGRLAGMRAVTAMLLSARFPVVSPSGALLRCVRSDPAAHADSATRRDRLVTYAVDGGYYENSGLLSLLQIWGALEPLVAARNAAAASSWRIVPSIVLADNHYRSMARAAPQGRPLELVVPIKAVGGNALFGQAALEQMAALAMGRGQTAPRGLDTPGILPRGTGEVRSTTAGGCFRVLAPVRQPSVAAPLGWVLSEASMEDLDAQLASRLRDDDSEPGSGVCALRREVVGSGSRVQ
jgi:hypothetical protein